MNDEDGFGVEWWASHNIFKRRIEVVGMIKSQGGGAGDSVAMPLSFFPISQGEAITPSLTLSMSEAQGLVDALWGAGIVPSKVAIQSSELGAVKLHLEDMRKVAFSFIDLQK